MIALLRRLFSRGPRGPSSPSLPTVADGPRDCPLCSGDLTAEPGGWYACAGLPTVEKAFASFKERYPSLPPPKSLAPVAACGWRGHLDGFGRDWW